MNAERAVTEWVRRAVLAVGLAWAATGCADPVTIADAEGQAIVYGAVSSSGASLEHVQVQGIVYRGNSCGDEFQARPFLSAVDEDGDYRVHLRVLTRDPFRGCIEIAAIDTLSQSSSGVSTEEGVLFPIAPPLDSVRIDLDIE